MAATDEHDEQAVETAPFTVDPADHLAFQTDFARGNKARWILPLLVVAVAGFNIWISVDILADYHPDLAAAPWPSWINLVLGLLLLFAFLPLRRFAIRRAYRASGLEGVVQIARFDPAGVKFRRDGSHSEMSWQVVHAYSDLPGHFIVWVNQRIGLIVPKRALKSPADEARIRKWFSAAGVSGEGRQAKIKTVTR